MRAGYKVAAAGLAVLLGCGIVAFTPRAGTSASAQGALPTASANVLTSSSSASQQHALYRDGDYRASAHGKMGAVPVTVTVEDGVVSRIMVGQNDEVPAMADKATATVVPQIIEKQSVEDIDVATGATCTSDAIIEAVSQALSRAAA